MKGAKARASLLFQRAWMKLAAQPKAIASAASVAQIKVAITEPGLPGPTPGCIEPVSSLVPSASSPPEASSSRARRLPEDLFAIDNPTFRKIVGRHFHMNAIAYN